MSRPKLLQRGRIQSVLRSQLSITTRKANENKAGVPKGRGKGYRSLCSSAFPGDAVDTHLTAAVWAHRVAAWKRNSLANIDVAVHNIANASCSKLQRTFAAHAPFITVLSEVGTGAGYTDRDFLIDLERVNPQLTAISVSRMQCKKRSGGVALVCAGDLLGSTIIRVSDYDEFDWLLAVEIHLPERKKPLGLVVCYVPGSGKYYRPSMAADLARVFMDFSSRTGGVVMTGDFNLRLGRHPGSWYPWVNHYFQRHSMDDVTLDARARGIMSAGGIAVSGRVPGDMHGGFTNYHRLNGMGTLIDDAFVDLRAFSDICFCQKGKVDRSVSTHVPVTYQISKASFWEYHNSRTPFHDIGCMTEVK